LSYLHDIGSIHITIQKKDKKNARCKNTGHFKEKSFKAYRLGPARFSFKKPWRATASLTVMVRLV